MTKRTRKILRRISLTGLIFMLSTTILFLFYMVESDKGNRTLVLQRDSVLKKLNEYVKSFDSQNYVTMGSEEYIAVSINHGSENFNDAAFNYLIDELNSVAAIHDVRMLDGYPSIGIAVEGTSITKQSINTLIESELIVATLQIGPEIQFSAQTLSDLIKLWSKKGLCWLVVYGNFSQQQIGELRDLQAEYSEKFKKGEIRTPLGSLVIRTNKGEEITI